MIQQAKRRKKKLHFPKFNNYSENMSVRKMFKFVKSKIMIYGHKLNFKVMYPSNTENHNDNFGLKIFDESSNTIMEKYG